MKPIDVTVKNSGISYLFRGFKLLSRKGLRVYIILPIFISILFYISIFLLGIHEMKHLINWMQSWVPNWLYWLRWLLWVLFAIAALIIVTYTYTFFANLFGAPFNGLLAEKAEELLTGRPVTTENAWRVFLKSIPYALKQQIKVLGYYLPRAIFCLILLLIPVIHIPAAILWFIFGAWMMAIQYVIYPMENHQIPFREIRTKLGQQKIMNLGFGTAVMLASMIPIVNLIVMPAAVLGATLLWVENYQADHIKNKT